MKTSDKGRAMIQAFEGYRDRVYRDPAGKLTGGIGHLLNEHAFRIGDEIGAVLIEAWFNRDIDSAETLVKSAFTPFEIMAGKQEMFDALVSLAFNIPSAFNKRTGLRNDLDRGYEVRVPTQIRRWVYATVNGKKTKLPGLVKRREAEARLFETGVYPGDGARPILSLGSKGEDVKRLQESLNRLLWWQDPLKVDGQFGPKTEDASWVFVNLTQTDPRSSATTPAVWAAIDAAIKRTEGNG